MTHISIYEILGGFEIFARVILSYPPTLGGFLGHQLENETNENGDESTFPLDDSNLMERPMASKKWMVLPGGRVTRWKKSDSDRRPGRWYPPMYKTPPKWLCKQLHKIERQEVRLAICRGEAEPCYYVHPTDGANYW